MEYGSRTVNTDVQAIREDLNILKSDAATLARDIRNNGGAIARDSVDQLRETGSRQFEKVESHVRNKPAQSLILAFCGGLVFSYLMGRRY